MLLPLLTIGLGLSLVVTLAGALSPLRSLLTPGHHCPKCGNDSSLKRVSRRSWERFVGMLVASRRYRCLACRWDGLLREGALQPTATTAPSTIEV